MRHRHPKKTLGPVERVVQRFPLEPVPLPEGMRRVGLALSGGGSHGAFTAGIFHTVFTRYLEAGRLPKLRVVSGTSTGSLVGALIAELYGRFKTGQDPKRALDKLFRLYTMVFQDQVALVPGGPLSTIWNLLTKGGVADISPLRKLIDENIEPDLIAAAAVGEHPTEFVATVIDMVVGHPRGFNSGEPNDMAIMSDVIFASCAQPVVMTPAYVSFADQRRWVTDGGVREVIPFREAMRPGTTHICAVALNEASIDADPTMTEDGATDPLKRIDRGLSVMNDEVARDDERMARSIAFINRARDRLVASGIAQATVDAALPFGELLPTDGDPADPSDHDPNDDGIYDESKLREILFFRFKTQNLPSSMEFMPWAMAPLFAQGKQLAEENMAEIQAFLEVDGLLPTA